MKKAIRLVSVLILCTVLTACRNTDFINLASFTDNYNKVRPDGSKIDFSSFYSEMKDETEILSFFPFNTDNVAVRLITDSKKQIGEARIIIRKADKNGNPISVSNIDFESFQTAASSTCSAFSNGEITDIPDKIVPKSISDLSADSEKTAESGSYYFIYRSNSLVSEIVIKNKWLSPVETTKKPENKEPFANMTETRSNTVPHK